MREVFLAVIGNLLLSIGAMKAGTSWLYMQLRDHPQIDSLPLKEIHYFAQRHTDYKIIGFRDRLQRIKEGIVALQADHPAEARASLGWFGAYLAEPTDDAWFASLYDDPLGTKWCAEFSNLNVLLPPAGWQHARNVARRIRIIYTLRNPLERLWSHTRFHLAFTGAFAQLAEWQEADFRGFLALPEIASHGRYAYVLDTLDQNFDRGDYHILMFEDIETIPDSVLAGIEAFLGISPGVYNQTSLVEHHNMGPQYAMPQAFAAAAKPMVEIELAALDARGFPIPLAWHM
jgi:hypothetical protein